jgi:hypothetical protein
MSVTSIIARSRQRGNYTFAAAAWAIAPTNETNKTNKTPTAGPKVALVAKLGCYVLAVSVVLYSDKLALSRSLALR